MTWIWFLKAFINLWFFDVDEKKNSKRAKSHLHSSSNQILVGVVFFF